MNQGQNGATSTVSFQIANLNQLSNADFAPQRCGGAGTSITGVGSYFDFGLPFFYGRTVFTGHDSRTGASAPRTSRPRSATSHRLRAPRVQKNAAPSS